ncbi:MAG: nucleotidyltransferase family protein [Patescibacteria group bacterium]
MSGELENIKKIVSNNKDYLRDTYGIKDLGIFGSFARKENTLLSDVDVLFEIEEKNNKTSLFDLVEMKNFLEKILGKTVDLVDKRRIKPALKEKILKEAIML